MKKTKLESSNKNVTKYIFEKENDIAIEAVLYKYNNYKDRTVICCSTQCGCPMGCKFCGTGEFYIRNLTTEEIVEQITAIMKDIDVNHLEIQKFQIMFMSMGEPMLNIHNVIEAMKELNSLYPNAQLLISTVAPNISLENYINFIEYAKTNNKVGLQISVHESTDKKRNELIKANSFSLRMIRHVGEMFAEITGRQPFFNYCVHKNNSSDKDIENLKAHLNPNIWQCTLSVICEKEESVKSSIDRQLDLINSFNQRMINAGYSTRVFNPDGQDDIGGGCGQLWYFQKWVKNKLAKTDNFYKEYADRAEKALDDFNKALDDLEDKRFNFNLNLVKEAINKINKNKKIITKAIFTDEQFDYIYDYTFQLEILSPNKNTIECDEITNELYDILRNKLIIKYRCEEPFFINTVSHDNELCYESYSKILNF